MKTLIIGLILLSSLAWSAPTAFDQKFNKLQKDMAQDQVKALLGSPDLREVAGDLETWHYNEGGGRRIVFDHNKTSEFGLDLPKVAPSPTPIPAPTNLGIGEACKKDAECKDHNCHFNKCAGSNNCTVPVGQVCSINDDCCGGWCDFQICKKKR